MKLCVTSVMLPHWTLEETFEKLRALGYQGLELRCRYNPDDPDAEPSYWGRHVADVSPDNLLDKAPEIRRLSEQTGIRVVALAPRALVGEWEEIERLAEGARAIDPECPPMIRVGAPRHDRNLPYWPQFLRARAGFAELVERGREWGVKFLYEIHVGTVAVTCSRAHQLLRDLDPDHIGAIYDVPNMVRMGLEDTRLGMELLGPHLAHCHIGNGRPVPGEPDGTGHVAWKWEFASCKTGLADIPQIIADFKAVGYQGYLSVEEFGPGDDEQKLREEAQFLRQCMEAQ